MGEIDTNKAFTLQLRAELFEQKQTESGHFENSAKRSENYANQINKIRLQRISKFCPLERVNFQMKGLPWILFINKLPAL